jgi:senataxin
MLTQQFRRHAAIVAFPSAYFYQGRLRSDATVAARPAAPFHLPAAAPLAPFVFFDVADGSERFQPGATSALNSAEAELAAALYRRLAKVEAGPGGDVSDAMRRLAPRVGFVTPYKGQADELRRVLRDRLGPAVAEALAAAKAVNTVDGFQGAERDVIILSLVRTRGGSLGHVDDVRRMNVGLTRAQRALWVLGHRRALEASPHWARLVEHARATGALVRHPGPQSLQHDARPKQATQHGRSGR